MRKSITLLFLFLIGISAETTAQKVAKMAFLNEDGTISVEEAVMPESYNGSERSESFDQLWRFGRPANPTFKNFRGVTLADLDGDGVEEVLYGINNTLYALKGDGTVFWEKQVSGTITLPPTVADLNGDGNLEIVLNTGGVPAAGRVYLMNSNGEDLPGWPLNFDDHWMINAPAVADLDGDGILDIITGERVGATQGFVHAIKMDGSPLNSGWPVEISSTPGFTPSIGDVNNDGSPDVVISGSAGAMYVFDNQGQLLPGFPAEYPGVSYSYQSPILVDLDGDGFLSIVGSNHGDASGFYVMNHDGTYREGWPVSIDSWTYSPSTVLDVDGDGVFDIFMSDRVTSYDNTPLPVIYGLDPDGGNLPDFPIEKYGGTEGVLSIADVNGDGILDIIFPSVMTDEDGYGYIHAYSLDGSGEIDGFPLRPRGFTFTNGAVLGDVNNDGLLDITVNSYTTLFGAGVDSTFVTVYNLNVPYNPDSIKRNGYKGSNTRDGYFELEDIVGIQDYSALSSVKLYPNPSHGDLEIILPRETQGLEVTIYTIEGKRVFSETIDKSSSVSKLHYDLNHLTPGVYLVRLTNEEQSFTGKWVRK